MAMTQEEINSRQREYRKKTSNACTNKYERTPKGFLMRKYRNMLSRVSGIQKKKAHLYEGLSILSREDFYEWATSSPEFNELFEAWSAAGHERGLCPTVDRIDSSRGYELDNMEWITHSENSRRGAISRHSKKGAYENSTH